jgi:hypothetical protein
LDQLSADRSLDRFRGEYQKILRAVRKSHGAPTPADYDRLWTVLQNQVTGALVCMHGVLVDAVLRLAELPGAQFKTDGVV